ncbi:MAG TPA: hypothetical protein VF585_10940, partial [Chthoniobacterales bacterium]
MNTLAPESCASLAAESDDVASRGRRRASGRWRAVARAGAVRLISIGVCLVLWQSASTKRLEIGFLRFSNVPPPTEVASAGVRLAQGPKFLSHVRSSVVRIFTGFAIAAALAVPLGMVIGRSRLAGDVFLAPLEVLRPIPAVAWIPLAILMFATAEQSMIYITFIGAFFPILLSTVHGVESLDRKLVFASMTLGAGR